MGLSLNPARSYHMAYDPPPAMPWRAYKATILKRWSSLLQSYPQEREIQAFLEEHPAMVPGAFSLAIKSGHFPMYGSLITQPVLPDFHFHRPDFMWIATSSLTVYPVLIEIEAPSKRWFNASGTPNAHLTQAISQLIDWKAWFEDPLNVQRFQSFYGIARPPYAELTLRPAYVLIYGRGAEANRSPQLRSKRATMQGADQFFLTHDSLAPDSNADQFWCIRGEPGHWRAISVPPTTLLSPQLAEERSLITGREEAIDACSLFSDQRAIFIKRRLKYWDEWVRQDTRGAMNTGDWE